MESASQPRRKRWLAAGLGLFLFVGAVAIYPRIDLGSSREQPPARGPSEAVDAMASDATVVMRGGAMSPAERRKRVEQLKPAATVAIETAPAREPSEVVDTKANKGEQPTLVVDGMVSAVLTVLRDGSLGSKEKRRRIEQVVYANFDLTLMSRLVMSRYWRRLSPLQQEEFVTQFKRHLSATYVRNIDRGLNGELVILGNREETHGDITVHTKIVRGGGTEDILVDYRLRQRNGEWLIIDFIVGGMSLIGNFSSQLQGSGPISAEDLLLLLREKNDARELRD